LEALRREVEAVSAARDQAITGLRAAGVSLQAIADATGLSKGRIAQIVRRCR
jgi:ribosomal protein S11